MSSKRSAAKFVEDTLGLDPTPDRTTTREYQPTTRGEVTNMGICAFWATLFLANEGLPRTKKMTDAEIKAKVLNEFPAESQPDRTRGSLEKLELGIVTVNYYRGLYNKGRLTRETAPDNPSKRYGDSGDIVNPKTGRPIL
jgi:hypothetical protein